ncbi:hypothetical protein [Candidatus Williamhamiltonella defendens]|uniref:hypothetical protein n=1 Tax=Candidatus Williamhamiltonella defendens TaxID=138072 RepID=UPI00130D73DC|nr:hypothetical protein [Candidatus Hamiltonella defensa]
MSLQHILDEVFEDKTLSEQIYTQPFKSKGNGGLSQGQHSLVPDKIKRGGTGTSSTSYFYGIL